jgi:hypothetical protein
VAFALASPTVAIIVLSIAERIGDSIAHPGALVGIHRDARALWRLDGLLISLSLGSLNYLVGIGCLECVMGIGVFHSSSPQIDRFEHSGQNFVR